MDSVKLEPHWPVMFEAAEAQLRAQDFDGRDFVVEMLQFGMRCYIELNRLEQLRQTKLKDSGWRKA